MTPSTSRTARAFWLAQLGGWGAYGLSLFLTFWPNIPEHQHGIYLVAKLGRAGLGLLASLVLLRIYRVLRGAGASPAALIPAALAGCAVLGALWMVAYHELTSQVILRDRTPLDWPGVPRNAIDAGFVLLTWSGIYFGVLHWRASEDQSRRVREAEHRLREEQLLAREAQFQLLSGQVNPHFLFNALNATRQLIGESGPRAQVVLGQIAELLRYTLVTEPYRQIPLGEELQVLRDYLAIEGVRLDDRLVAHLTIEPPAGECLIPRFLLLPLVENAAKYGEAGPDGSLRIALEAAVIGGRLRIEVRNTGVLEPGDAGRPARAGGTGIGWPSVRTRLAHLYPDGFHFDVIQREGEVVATVELPARLPEAAQHA